MNNRKTYKEQQVDNKNNLVTGFIIGTVAFLLMAINFILFISQLTY